MNKDDSLSNYILESRKGRRKNEQELNHNHHTKESHPIQFQIPMERRDRSRSRAKERQDITLKCHNATVHVQSNQVKMKRAAIPKSSSLSNSTTISLVPKTKHALKVKKAIKTFLTPNKKDVQHQKKKGSKKSRDMAVTQKAILEYEGPSLLHTICYTASSLNLIMEALYNHSSNPSVYWEKDLNGRNCFHLLGLNTSLMSSIAVPTMKKKNKVLEETKVHDFMDFLSEILLPDHVNILIEEDGNGQFPFEEPIRKWIDSVSTLQGKRATTAAVSLKNTVKIITGILHTSHHHDIRQDIRKVDSSDTDPTINMSPSEEKEDKMMNTSNPDNEPVILPLHIQFIMHILSDLIDSIRNMAKRRSRIGVTNDNSGRSILRPRRLRVDLVRDLLFVQEQLEERFASVPNFMFMLLSIEDEMVRDRIFESPIVKRVMVRKESLGNWLSIMLQDERSRRAIDYLSRVSDILAQETKYSLTTKDQKRLDHRTNELCDAFGELESVFPSMLALPRSAMEEISTLPFMAKVLDRLISTPFMAVQLFVDTFLTALLIFCFRKSVDGYLLGHNEFTILRWVYAVNACVFYLLIRELAKAVSIVVISNNTRFLKSQILGLTINITSLFVLISCVLTIRITVPLSEDVSSAVRTRFAFTSGLLWIRLLTVMKSINIKLATFVMAIVQITMDTFWYMMILIAIVFCFAQIFFTLLVPYGCSSHSVDQTLQNSLDCNPSEYYLKVYFVMLGQDWLFDREDFRLLPLLVFIGFSFLIAIVLLNVLIAIIGDSYERCLLRSRHLFGRARIVLLAELVALRDLFHEPGEVKSLDHSNCYIHPSRSFHWTKRIRWTKGGFMFGVFSACALVGWIIAEIYAQSNGTNLKNEVLYSVMIVAINIIVFAFFLFILSDRSRSSGVVTQTIEKLMRKLLGKGEDSILENEDWKGRVNYITNEMQRMNMETIQETKLLMNQVEQSSHLERKELEQRLDMKLETLYTRVEEMVLSTMSTKSTVNDT